MEDLRHLSENNKKNNVDSDSKAGNDTQTTLQLLKIITALICDVKINENIDLDENIANSEEFKKLYNNILDIRLLSSSLNKGNLDRPIGNKGFVLANLKALQSNLRHLTWQTKKIAEGDFSQSVDFLGEFSDSFNKMTKKLRESNVQLQELASLDALTKMPNRRSLTEFLDNIFIKHQEMCMFMIDIDHFKYVNDNYGHDVGDEVLVHISHILTQQLRNTDFISRYGGEEFLAILPGTSLDVACKIAARIIYTIGQTPLKISTGGSISMTVSIGISTKNNADQSYKEVIKRCDEALYAAKNSGRNKFCVYDASTDKGEFLY